MRRTLLSGMKCPMVTQRHASARSRALTTRRSTVAPSISSWRRVARPATAAAARPEARRSDREQRHRRRGAPLHRSHDRPVSFDATRRDTTCVVGARRRRGARVAKRRSSRRRAAAAAPQRSTALHVRAALSASSASGCRCSARRLRVDTTSRWSWRSTRSQLQPIVPRAPDGGASVLDVHVRCAAGVRPQPRRFRSGTRDRAVVRDRRRRVPTGDDAVARPRVSAGGTSAAPLADARKCEHTEHRRLAACAGRNGGIDTVPLPVTSGGLSLCGKHAIGPDLAAAMAAVRRHHRRVPGGGVRAGRPLARTTCAWLHDHVGGERRVVPHPRPARTDARARPSRSSPSWSRRLDDGEHLLMHCAAGIGRTGTMAACLLMRAGHALPTMRSHWSPLHRPMAGPEVGPQLDLVNAWAARRGRPESVSKCASRDLLRHAHRPGFLHQLAQLLLVDRGEPHDHPVVPHVALARGSRNLCGSLVDQSRRAAPSGTRSPSSVSSRLNATNTMRPTRNFTRSRTTTSYDTLEPGR